jgi:hypothetical protein
MGGENVRINLDENLIQPPLVPKTKTSLDHTDINKRRE